MQKRLLKKQNEEQTKNKNNGLKIPIVRSACVIMVTNYKKWIGQKPKYFCILATCKNKQKTTTSHENYSAGLHNAFCIHDVHQVRTHRLHHWQKEHAVGLQIVRLHVSVFGQFAYGFSAFEVLIVFGPYFF